MSLTEIAVSAAQTEKIKRAIEVHLRSQQPRLRGHFCSRKGTGHTTIEQVSVMAFICATTCAPQVFLSGVSVPLSPCKSRVVEAVYILLCQKYFEAKRSSGTGKMNVLKCSISLLM